MRAFICSCVTMGALISGACAPRQDPGVPIPRSADSGAAAMSVADAAVAQQADTLSAIDAAKRVVAENLSNADTIGYKALCCRVQGGAADVYLNLDQGVLETTNRQLDLAINGPGFFRVKADAHGDSDYAYTRNGNFFMNRNNELVIGPGNGFRLTPAISIPPDITDLNISQDGVVSVVRAGSATKETIGQIKLYQLADAAHLKPDGTLYLPTAAAGDAVELSPKQSGVGYLQQNFLESSNVDLNREKLRSDFLDRWRAQLVK